MVSLLAVSACVTAPELEPTRSFPPAGDANPLDDFAINLDINGALEHNALRKPELARSIDAQIAAMLGYVREHGQRAAPMPALPRSASQALDVETTRLGTVAIELMPYLDLEAGPRQLSDAALGALLQLLGPDAELRPAAEASAVGGDLALGQRDGIAFLGLRTLDDAMADRIAAVLTQWSGSDHPPRAIILDLSRCEDASPSTATLLVNAFAPGRTAFALEGRDPRTGSIAKHAFQGDAAWSAGSYAATPIFVIVSEATGSLGEAVTLALRQHRAARVIGTPTRGTGRLMAWLELPDHRRFAFTIADVSGANGESLHGAAIVPDACAGDAGLFALQTRTLEAARERCARRRIVQGEAIDYVHELLRVEAESASPPLPLQNGETKT